MGRDAAAFSWTLQLLAAGILLQTLFFKFTGAEESVHIFSQLGLEPWGRYASGAAELVAALLLVTPALVPLGAALSMAIITGAIVSHVTVIGIEVQGDGGLLFGLAVGVWIACAVILVLRRSQSLAMIGDATGWLGLGQGA